MSPERLQQLERIFQTALDLPPDRRATFLDEACANDPDLRVEVESLITSYDAAGDFIEGSAADVAVSMLAAGPLHGKRLAHYTVGELLGAEEWATCTRPPTAWGARSR